MNELERLTESGGGGVRVAVAESLTSGMLSAEVGKAEHASEWFAGAVVAYGTDVKEKLLGLEPGRDPCSGDCAEELADGVRRLLDADVAVSTTGVGGPASVDGHEPGTVYVVWATSEDRGHVLLHVNGDPEEVLTKTVATAVALLADVAEQCERAR